MSKGYNVRLVDVKPSRLDHVAEELNLALEKVTLIDLERDAGIR